jgi:hypothetical protein
MDDKVHPSDTVTTYGKGMIVAQSPSNILSSSHEGFPRVYVDFEMGTHILVYIKATTARYSTGSCHLKLFIHA